MICKICNKEYSNKHLSYHISQSHKMSKRYYYDTYIKTDKEGLCKYCGGSSKFINIIKGYNDFCSKSCASKYRAVHETIEQRNLINQKRLNTIKLHRANMTPEEREKDHISHVNAQRNRSEESKLQTSKKLKERCANRTQEEKDKMFAKMVETKKNWPNEKKEADRLRKSKANQRRWQNISDTDRQKFKEKCKKTYWSNTVIHINEINDKRQEARINYMKNKPSYNGIFFDSNWELEVYKYCIIHNIPIERKTSAIKYIHNGKEKSTYPDFYIDGIIVEIKGKQFINPDGTWSNPFLEIDDGSNEAKHQALLNHGVVIWYEKQVKEFLNGNMEVLYDKKSI